MQCEYDNFKWTRKHNGYYQRTRRPDDGQKDWLHQYKYEKEIGKIQEGYDVHHKDHIKGNNDITNLTCISSAEHRKEHSGQNNTYFKDNNTEIQILAKLAREGKYKGQKVQRKERSKDRSRVCIYCGQPYEMHKRSRRDSIYCSYECQQEHHKEKNRKGKITKDCIWCGNEFQNHLPQAKCCDGECSTDYRKERKRFDYRRKIGKENSSWDEYLSDRSKVC